MSLIYKQSFAKCFRSQCNNEGIDKWICGGCFLFRYCSRQCFTEDFNNEGHKVNCPRYDCQFHHYICLDCNCTVQVPKDLNTGPKENDICEFCATMFHHESKLQKATNLQMHIYFFETCFYRCCNNRLNPGRICSGCFSSSYCSSRCQKLDWKAGHKQQCSKQFHQKSVVFRCDTCKCLIQSSTEFSITNLKCQTCHQRGVHSELSKLNPEEVRMISYINQHKN